MVLESLIFSLMLQLEALPDEVYTPALSSEVKSALEHRERMEPYEFEKAIADLAEQGDDSAADLLGEILYGGLMGVERNAARACDYFERLDKRRASGMHNLATCYYSGDGRKQDLVKARQLYARAAENGWRGSYCAYGNMLVKGEGGPKDAEEGLRLCRMTAVAGDPNAQTDYGGYLLTGVGTERDPATARFMLEQAGGQGQPNAAFLLGQIYSRGDGTAVDHTVASEWFANAYEWGRGDAAYEAGRSFLRLGYKKQEDGRAQVKPAYLRQAQDWFAKALASERPGSERHENVRRIARAVEQMLASAAADSDSN